MTTVDIVMRKKKTYWKESHCLLLLPLGDCRHLAHLGHWHLDSHIRRQKSKMRVKSSHLAEKEVKVSMWSI